MKMPNKKILAVAVASAFAGAASAATITIPNTTAATPAYASQIAPGTGVALTNVNQIVGLTGWGWSSGTAVFIRYDLSSGKFTANPAAMQLGIAGSNTVNANATSTLSAGGAGAANAIYQITSSDSNSTTAGSNAMLTLAGVTATSTAGDITITQNIYDTASNAVAGGTTGRLASAKTGTIISFTSAYSVTGTAGTAQTADVLATLGSYKQFVSGANTVPLGQIVIANAGSANTAAGAAAEANEVLGTGTRITVTGDFTAAANANGTYTGAALSRVFLSNTNCAGTFNIVANELSATTAVVPTAGSVTNPTSGVTSGNSVLCFTAAGNSAIPVASYTAVFTPIARTTAYAVSPTSSMAVGSIIRNGGQLISPWFTLASGWISRWVLTNSSSTPATYAVVVSGEAGNTITANPAGATGTVPANGMVVINASDIVTSVSGNTRAQVTFTFAAARSTIDAIYQTVNAATGSISSQTMVAPGTN